MPNSKKWLSKLKPTPQDADPKSTNQPSAAIQRANQSFGTQPHKVTSTTPNDILTPSNLSYSNPPRPPEQQYHTSYFYQAPPGRQSAAIQRANRGLTSKHHDFGYNYAKSGSSSNRYPHPPVMTDQAQAQLQYQYPPPITGNNGQPVYYHQYPTPPADGNYPVYDAPAQIPHGAVNGMSQPLNHAAVQQQYYGVPANPYASSASSANATVNSSQTSAGRSPNPGRFANLDTVSNKPAELSDPSTVGKVKQEAQEKDKAGKDDVPPPDRRKSEEDDPSLYL